MILERRAPAKINLGLHVLRKRSDGYHDLETVFVRIPWSDRLAVNKSDTFSFTCSDGSLPVNSDNLCVKAAQLLINYKDVRHGAALHLEKKIPYGAGLGGGSSDAATTLQLLNAFWQLDLTHRELHDMACELGSDVPFFLEDGAAYATGRGEVLEPLMDPVYVLPYTVVVVVPGVHVSTAEAYGAIVPCDQNRQDIKKLVMSNDLDAWRQYLVNDFEVSVFERHPVLAEVKKAFYEGGAGYAVMSGSGSAIFGLFTDSEQARRHLEKSVNQGLTCWISSQG